MAPKKKTGIISQARMTSTRLPGKILLEARGRPMLAYHIARLADSKLPVYIATTTNGTDDIIVEFAREHRIECCRGPEENVLERYYSCAKKNELDIIIRVTSDCPLIDGKLIRQGLDKYLELDDDNVYLSNTMERTFPRGFDFEIFSFGLLEDAFVNAATIPEKEHVTPYINQNKSGKVKLVSIANTGNYGDFRITLDTPEDFELLQRLIEDYDADHLSHTQITEVLAKHPELVKINAHIEQKKN